MYHSSGFSLLRGGCCLIKIKLGPGDDIVASSRAKYSGFGGTLLGGPGKDTIILGKGKWTISGKIITEGNSEVPTAFSGDMFHVKDFEQIGGNSGDLFTFRDGTLTVDSRGVGIFA